MLETLVKRRVLRTAAAVSALALAFVAAPAAAHVTVDSDDATAGGWATFAFSVPTESEDASTTRLEVRLPEGAEMEHMSTRTKPGWEVEVDTDSVVWTADPAAAIPPGEFDVFEIRGGPLPTDTDTLSFAAIQTYSDGETVAWDQPPTDDGTEPERPAPTVALAADESDTSPPSAPESDAAESDALEAGDESGSTDMVLLGGAVLVLAAVVLVVALRRRRSPRR